MPDLFDDDELPPCVGEKMREITRTLGARDCVSYAADIERYKAPEQWKRAIEGVPEECRPEVREYLAAMWVRRREAIKARGGKR